MLTLASRLLTPLLAQHPPEAIAVSAIYYACLTATPQIALPLQPKPWWELFDVESEDVIWEVCRTVLQLYKDWGIGADRNKEAIWRSAAKKTLPVTKAALREGLDSTV